MCRIMNLRRAGLSFVVLCAALSGCTRPTFNRLMAEGRDDLRLGSYPDAIAMFKQADRVKPGSPEPAYYMGVCNLRQADERFQRGNLAGALTYCDRALADFDAAVAAHPGFSRAVDGKADALRLKGRNQAAMDLAEWVAANSGPQAFKLTESARLYVQSGDYDNAELAYRKAMKIEPRSAAVFAEAGLFYYRCGNKSRAIHALTQAQRLDPSIRGIGTTLAQLGVAVEGTSRTVGSGDAEPGTRNSQRESGM